MATDDKVVREYKANRQHIYPPAVRRIPSLYDQSNVKEEQADTQDEAIRHHYQPMPLAIMATTTITTTGSQTSTSPSIPSTRTAGQHLAQQLQHSGSGMPGGSGSPAAGGGPPGGGPPNPNPAGSAPLPPPGVLGTGAGAIPPPGDQKIMGALPEIFSGDRDTADKFIK